MKQFVWISIGVLVLGGCLLSRADATVFEITVQGRLVSQINPGVDPLMSVGDTITVSSRFDDSRVMEWGSYGYKIAGLYGLPTTGVQFWNAKLNGLTWKSQDEFLDGAPFGEHYNSLADSSLNFSKTLGAPAFIFTDHQVLGLAGWMIPVGTNSTPNLQLGSYTGSGIIDNYQPGPEAAIQTYINFTPATLSSAFQITEGGFLYGNSTPSLGFNGIWDFANVEIKIDGAIAAPVPELSTWGLMLIGFGTLAVAARNRNRRAAKEA